MLGLNELKQTKVYQEALEEGEIKGRLQGKLEVVVPLLERGFAVEVIAEILGLEIEQVRVAAQNPDITNKA